MAASARPFGRLLIRYPQPRMLSRLPSASRRGVGRPSYGVPQQSRNRVLENGPTEAKGGGVATKGSLSVQDCEDRLRVDGLTRCCPSREKKKGDSSTPPANLFPRAPAVRGDRGAPQPSFRLAIGVIVRGRGGPPPAGLALRHRDSWPSGVVAAWEKTAKRGPWMDMQRE